MKVTNSAARRHGNRATLVGLWAAAMALAACGCKKETVAPPRPSSVVVVEIAATNVPLHTEIIGQLDSPQNVEVRARVEAFVEKILFTEGSHVKEGAPLFQLDRKPFEQRLAAMQGLMAEAKAALNKSEKDVARLTPLAAKKAIPLQDLDDAVASVEVGKAGLLTADARVQSAQIDLGYCDVVAPISGLIGAKQVSVGELVGKGQPTLMATISMLDPIWFYCAVSEVQFLKAEAEARRTGKKVDQLPSYLILADGSVHPNQGKFVFIDRAVDPKTGTLRLRAEFANPGQVLRPGMFARIKVDLGTRPDAILAPERSVTELQGKHFVWVIDQENKATQRTVKLGETVGGNVLVLEGLKPGERIVVEGLQKVRQGAVVEPMTAAQLAESAKAAEMAGSKPAAKE